LKIRSKARFTAGSGRKQALPSRRVGATGFILWVSGRLNGTSIMGAFGLWRKYNTLNCISRGGYHYGSRLFFCERRPSAGAGGLIINVSLITMEQLE